MIRRAAAALLAGLLLPGAPGPAAAEGVSAETSRVATSVAGHNSWVVPTTQELWSTGEHTVPAVIGARAAGLGATSALAGRNIWVAFAPSGLRTPQRSTTQNATSLPAAARRDGWSVTLSAARARPGDRVRVIGANWPAGQLVQLVTCGELALPGSSSCDMRAALATAVGNDGGFAVTLTVGEPPRPCPCVVHVSAVGTGDGGHVDAPIEISGHQIGPVPTPARTPARLDVVEARLTGGRSFAAWLGAPHRRTLVYTVRNAGTQTLSGVPLTVRVGDGADAVPGPATGELRPGETRTYQVSVPIPFAAIGDYPVTVEMGGLGQARAVHEAWPWGLLVLNLLGLVMIAFGVRRLLRRRRARGHGPQLAVDGPVLLPAVVRLPDLGAYLVFDDAPGAGRIRRLSGGRLSPDDLRRLLERDAQQPTAVVDLDALDTFLTSRESR
ncbi:hypothetical protein GCM10009679_32150 [Saccharothrix algeriensis]|uniref:DUF11 domain-containing protein n=1 Tax=Catellatospora bangladeshensis TaxID=310355 RepID=A0A8J3NKR5_9ACTN|nr:hypothetical protein Cba03nite_43250 [Catellatospora bangladeshensis]